MKPDFDRDTALVRSQPGRYTAQLARHWWVGPGPNGGLLAALTLQAARLELDDPARKPRSLTLHYLAAAAEGELELLASVERSGSRVSNCTVRLEQDGRLIALALTVFAVELTTSRAFADIAVPEAPRPETLEPIPGAVDGLPAAMQNFDYRFAFGQLPFTGAGESNAALWVRTVRRRRPDPLAIATFTDSWAPMPYTQLERGAGAPTLDLTIHFRDHGWYERASDEAFVLAEFRTRVLAGGLFEEDGELWSDDGVLLAQSRQLAMLVE